MRIAINGFGRIGRCFARLLHERGLTNQLQLVAINDLADKEVLTHLLRYDSTHGPFRHSVNLKNNQLTIDQSNIQFLSEPDLKNLPWKALDIDCVIECTGKFKRHAKLSEHLEAGAKRVLVSHPVEDPDLTLVYGVNHQLLSQQRIVSNASCTTNCLAPLVQVLDQHAGLTQGLMTTIHAYTNDQNLIDKAHGDKLRARAAAVSMIPTSTGAARSVGKVLPHLDGKLDGMSVRVPTLNVSLVDFQGLLQKDTSVDAIHQAFRQACDNYPQGVLAINDLPLVSSDFNHHPASCIIDTAQTRLLGRQIKMMAWYDNEWGFSNRLADVLLYWQKR